MKPAYLVRCCHVLAGLMACLAFAACGVKPNLELDKDLPKGTYAHVTTNKGDFVIELFADKAPKTVENYIGLAEGTKPFTNAKTGKQETRPFYDGLKIYFVQWGSVLETGCPFDIGSGGPGFQIEDEIHPDLSCDAPGMVGMSASSPNTGGSRFFVTAAPHPEFNGKVSIFGKVTRGMETVKAIVETPLHRGNVPLRDIVIRRIAIVRVP
jgi:peptidyl-prolyl cis-trans isomerase A (cyclophilin A)